MAVVLRFEGYRVVIYPNDHRPAHVHVKGAGVEAVFVLNCPGGPPELRESFGFRSVEIGRIIVSLAEHLSRLCEEWRRRHGDH